MAEYQERLIHLWSDGALEDYPIHYLRDANLSLAAKGLLAILIAARNSDNKVAETLKQIIDTCGIEREEAAGALYELMNAGYVSRTFRCTSCGRETIYVVHPNGGL